MTTDPRVIECAKAMHGAAGIMIPWNVLDDRQQHHLLIHARACILKWLEQEPSDGMLSIDVRSVDNDEYSSVTKRCADQLYAAMCAQAAKEIAGG